MSGVTDEDAKKKYEDYLKKVERRLNMDNQSTTQSIENHAMTTQQFYGGLTAPLNQVEMNATGSIGTSSIPFQVQSDASIFKVPHRPKPTRSNWDRNESVVNNFVYDYRYSGIEKFFFKMWVRSSTEILSLARRGIPDMNNKEALFNEYCAVMKTKYYSSEPSDSMSSHSLYSLQRTDRPESVQSFASERDMSRTINVHPYARYPGEFDRTTLLCQPLIPDGNLYPSTIRDRITAPCQTQISDNDKTSSMIHQRPAPRPKLPGGRIQQTPIRPTQPANNILKPNVLDQTQNLSMIGAKGMTRSGRPVRSPHKYWKGVVNESHQQSINPNKTRLNNTSTAGSKCMTKSGGHVKSPIELWEEMVNNTNKDATINNAKSKRSSNGLSPVVQDLNETLTLRNKKMVVKSTPLPKRPTKKVVKNTSLGTIKEGHSDAKNKSKGGCQKKSANKKSSKNENKENTPSMLTKTSSTEDKNQMKAPPKRKPVKKTTVKRKSKEPDFNMAKKKKIEEEVLSDSDELFENVPRKRLQTVNQILSPSSGLNSVKKAAAAATGRETPPAKLISQLLDPNFGTQSSSKELPDPKISQVVKRVTKMVEKVPKIDAKKVIPVKPNSKDSQEIQKIISEVESCYRSADGKSVLTVFRGTEPDSDEESDLSENDDLF